MRPGRRGATATGRILLVLGGMMVLILGKGDITVIIAGLLIALGGVYVLSLVNPGTKRFMGTGWPEKICRTSAVIVGLLMVASGLISLIDGLRDMLIFHNHARLIFVLIGLLSFGWGLYISKIAMHGIQP